MRTVNTLARSVVGGYLAVHGAQKLFGMMGGNQVESWFAFPMGIAGILEFFGGILILLGLFTRPAAFLLCGQMAYAYFTVHLPQGFWPIENGGERAVLFCFIFLFLWWHGGGNLSIDAMLKKNKEAEA